MAKIRKIENKIKLGLELDELPEAIKKKIDEALPEGIKESEKKKIYEKAFEEYKKALVEPGESVGIIGAESIGEPATQMTLNTKHFSGVAELNVTTGLPRIIEIVDGRKTISTPSMEIYLKEEYENEEDVKKYTLQIKETNLYEIATEFNVNLEEFSIEVKLDEEKIKKLDLTKEKIIKVLNKGLKKLKVEEKEKILKFTFKSKEEKELFNELYKAKDKLKGVYVSGIKGIKQVLPVKKEEGYVLITSGTNLKEVMKLPYVDTYKTVSNDIFEIYEYFGIEAARQAIINEVYKVMENQGLNIDIRHLMLVADTMCNSSKVRGITRYGVVKEKSSVLARASFETALNHVINAALMGEKDPMNSIVENVMVNQIIPAGTGIPKLVMDLELKKK